MIKGENPGKTAICTRCGKRRKIDQFTYYPSKGRHHSWDNACLKEYNRERGAARRAAKALEAENAEVAS